MHIRIFPVLCLSLLLALTVSSCKHGNGMRVSDEFMGSDVQNSITGAKDKVFPAVVFLKVLKEEMERGKKQSLEVSGSGVIISPRGEVLSNWHVVNKAIEIRCLLFDGTACTAQLIGEDKDTDLALLQLQLPAERKLPFAQIADSSNVREGEFVMAMGAPWGLSRSISVGIISCARRYLVGTSEYSLWIQTDAAISPGNSGGPLVDTNGKIIGINTRAIMRGGDMGFAVPSATIVQVIPRLRKYGKANWSWTGLRLQPLNDFYRNIYFDAKEGVIVSGTDPESPARRAGIRARDRIIKINGKDITAKTEEDLPSIRRMLGLLPLEQNVIIELVRDKKEMKVEFVAREKGNVEGAELDLPRWDFTVKAINQFDNPDLYFHRKKGVFIYGVKYPGNAALAQLQKKDIILKVGSQKVNSLTELEKIHAEAIKNIDKKSKLVFTLLRNGLMRQVVLDFSRNFERE